MDIKILDSLDGAPKGRNFLFVGTHNGKFHAGDLVSCAILYLLESEHLLVIRTRNRYLLESCDLCVDVGGGTFDHNRPNFSEVRSNGMKYACAGLVWREFGKRLIYKLGSKYFPNSEYSAKTVFNEFDSTEIALIDAEDNKMDTYGKHHSFTFISAFLPICTETNYNEQFKKALAVTITVLEERLKALLSDEVSKNTVVEYFQNDFMFNDNILELPSQSINWIRTVTDINKYTMSDPIMFVIHPCDDGWAAHCVPFSLEDNFEKIVSFPKSWAGLTTDLPETCGIEGATLCNEERSYALAKSKDAIIAMCKKAYELEVFYAQFVDIED